VVGLVIVSHSAGLAAGVVELARQMGGEEVAIEAAGGMAEPEGAIGTDMVLVQAAIERAAGPDGVVVFMDLGSAVMSAEMAAEMVGAERDDVRVVLSDAPLVEGAVAAAARAAAGAPLDEVLTEARRALGMKSVQLGVEEPAGAGAGAPEPDAGPGAGAQELRLDVAIPLGIHARPAARIVEAAARFDARISVQDATTSRGPADARSLSGLVMLGVRQGHELLVRAEGPEADAALAALRDLAADGFGDAPGGAAPAPPPRPVAQTAQEPSMDEVAPPPPGTVLQGVPVAPGIVIAPARRLQPAALDLDLAAEEPAGDPAAERARLDDARAAARADIEQARERIAQRAGPGEAAIFDAHLLLLDDAALTEPAVRAIADGAGAATAWAAAVADAAAGYRGLDDAYLAERAADVEDVGGRVLRHLAGVGDGDGAAAARGILVVADLSPGEAAELDPELVDGLALARGGATSHAAILARGLGIPTIAGAGTALLGVADGTALVLDGTAGTVQVDPSPDALAERERARAAGEERRRRARERAHLPAELRDGRRVEVAANVGSADEVAGAVALGAEGVGLLRTEFLFLDRDAAPTIDEQREALEAVASGLEGRPLIVRTLDAGADKPLAYLDQAPEANPFLGVRGLRLGLERPDVLRDQLRAILAVAARHPVRIMFPMVATLAEYRAGRALVEEVRAELGAAPVEVGIMVEVPSVAVAADRFAGEVDFFSVGTNDLTQYTMAAERGNDAVAGLLDALAPPVLRLIAAVTRASADRGRWVGVCGELAGDPAAAIVLAGLGVDELSMAAPQIPAVKEALRGVSLADARAVAAQALDADDAAAVRGLVAPMLDAPSSSDG
jgi:phosphoenolpyruvate-protein phosphotransferase/dihydroxyacetone kinase phosphotransfer subunit